MTTMSIELYRQYLAASETTASEGKVMPYEWGRLPKSLSISWMAYRQMFDEFSREIANSINQLTDYAHRLKNWSAVISSMADQEKVDAAREFIDPLAIVGLTLPYVIRSRFIFAVAHLCHQANRSRDGIKWRDDFPLDDEIYFDAADKYGTGWPGYKPFKRCIERLGDKSYQTKTCDFRHAYNHRFSPHVVIGITSIVKRKVDTQTKNVTYAFGAIPALTVKVVAELLRDQCKHGYAAFGAFQKLIGEHEVSIAKYNLKHHPRNS
jgi:hypothetical protein